MARDIAEIRRDIGETRERLRDTAEAIGWKADVPARARDVMRETVAVVRERVASGSHAAPAGPDDGSPSLRDRAGAVGSAVSERLGSAKEGVAHGGEATAHGASSLKDSVAGGAGAVGRAASAVKDAAAGGVSATAGAVGHAQEAVVARVPDRDQAASGVGQIAATARANPVPFALGALALGAAVGVLLPSTRVEDERLGGAAEGLRERGAELGHDVVERGREAAETVSAELSPDSGETDSRRDSGEAGVQTASPAGNAAS
jgi:hypothetical protein